MLLIVRVKISEENFKKVTEDLKGYIKDGSKQIHLWGIHQLLR